ncbi:large conductance mechanosensitive channel protein MscL [Microbacterium sp. 22242]|uniref:large conductance mechanosensitive channel protein MscL n=1 Tax=Microbacterium sp. 22242 TaxID=3453896 RepID=UPI003F842F3B
MIKGFKEFILRGNVIDLAVAVVIGAAFSAIVDTVVKGLINPLIAFFFSAKDLNGLVWDVTNLQGSHTTFAYGSIIGAIINFLAVAVVVYFAFVMPMNHFKERQAAKAGVNEEKPEPLPTEQELLIQIRDLLEQQKTV